MEKEGLELASFTQKVATDYTVDSALLSMVSHNLEQRTVSVTGNVHQNVPRNTTQLFSTFFHYATSSYNLARNYLLICY
jgi:hypothetical protein